MTLNQRNQPSGLFGLLRCNGLTFLLFFVLTLILYFPTRDAGFVQDFFGSWPRYMKGDVENFLRCFGFSTMHQVYHGLSALMVKLFNVNGWPYYLIYSAIHALNALLLFRLSKRILEEVQLRRIRTIALTGSLLFLIQAYAVEVLVWRVMLNYLVSASGILGALWMTIKYWEEQKRWYLYIAVLLQFVALFSLEYAYMLPLMTGIIGLWIRAEYDKLNWALFSQISALGLYLVMYKYWTGKWIRQYGAEEGLYFDLSEMVGHLELYAVKHLTFLRFWPHDWKRALVEFLSTPLMSWSVLAITSFLLLWAYFSRKSNRLILVFGGLFTITLIPVLNRYFSWMLWSENDRYGYLASGWLMMLVSWCIFRLKKEFWSWVFVAIFAGLQIYFVLRINDYWKASDEVIRSLVKDYRWTDRDSVYILNSPDNMQGIYMMRSYDRPSAWKEGLEIYGGNKPHGFIGDVALYNMTTPADGVKVERLGPDTLKVRLAQWGSWFFRVRGGVKDYETRHHKVDFEGLEYRLIRKDTTCTYIYQIGNQWKEVDWREPSR